MSEKYQELRQKVAASDADIYIRDVLYAIIGELELKQKWVKNTRSR